MKWLESKKVKMSLSAIAATLIVALLGTFGLETTPEMKLKIVETAMALIALIGGVYTLAQGYADGKSGGVTSSSPSAPVGVNVSAASVFTEHPIATFLDILKASNLEIRAGRRPRAETAPTKGQIDNPLAVTGEPPE